MQQMEWTSVVEKCIHDLRSKHPQYSDSQIAKSINLPKSSFNRFINDRVKPSLDNYIKLVIGSGNGNLLREAISSYDSNLSHALKSTLEVAQKEQNIMYVSEDLDQVLHDRDTWVAFLLCLMDEGASEEQLHDTLGNNWQNAINKLKAFDLVVRTSRGHKSFEPKILQMDFDGYKHHAQTLLNYYRPENVGKGVNYINLMSEGLNDEGIAELQKAHKEFHRAVQNLMRNPKFKGNTPMFSVGFCDRLTGVTHGDEKGETLQ